MRWLNATLSLLLFVLPLTLPHTLLMVARFRQLRIVNSPIVSCQDDGASISKGFNKTFSQAHIMKVLLAVTCSLLLLLLLFSLPAHALQGKHLDSAISNVATPTP